MDRVTDDYGRKVNMALRAVRQMYQDASRLLTDCDGTVGKGLQLATKSANATRGGSYSLGQNWLIEGAYRCYQVDPVNHPGLVDVVCLGFIGEDVGGDEPVLILGRVKFDVSDESDIRTSDRCKGFEVWYLLADHDDYKVRNQVIRGGPVVWANDGVTFEWFRLVAVPLYSVKSINDVVALIDLARAE